MDQNGRVHDLDRVEYIEDHLKAVSELNKEGMDIAGYYVWSFLDNFEWSFGYSKRFGIVYINFDNQERIKKDSFLRYADIIQNRSL